MPSGLDRIEHRLCSIPQTTEHVLYYELNAHVRIQHKCAARNSKI